MRKSTLPPLPTLDDGLGDQPTVESGAGDAPIAGAAADGLREGDRRGLLAANRRFYKAFVDRDFSAMEEIWSQDHEVACIHPGWPALTGRERVMRSWQELMMSARIPAVRFGAERATVMGDVGLVVCEEYVDTTTVAVTNLFARTTAGWTLIHHQASAVSTAVTDDGLSSDAFSMDDFPDVPHTLH